MVQKNQMTGLFAAEIIFLPAHLLNNVPVADLGAYHLAAHTFHGNTKAEIAHHRGHEGFLFELFSFHHVGGAYCHDVIAVNDIAFFVANDHPVSITVQSDPQVSPEVADLFGHKLWIESAAFVVDVLAVRFNTDGSHLCPQFFKDMGSDTVGCAMGAVKYDVKAVQDVLLRKGVFQKNDVTAACVVNPGRLAYLFRHRPERRHLL